MSSEKDIYAKAAGLRAEAEELRVKAIDLKAKTDNEIESLHRTAQALDEAARATEKVIPDEATMTAKDMRLRLKQLTNLFREGLSWNMFFCGRGFHQYCNSEHLARKNMEQFQEQMVTAFFRKD